MIPVYQKPVGCGPFGAPCCLIHPTSVIRWVEEPRWQRGWRCDGCFQEQTARQPARVLRLHRTRPARPDADHLSAFLGRCLGLAHAGAMVMRGLEPFDALRKVFVGYLPENDHRIEVAEEASDQAIAAAYPDPRDRWVWSVASESVLWVARCGRQDARERVKNGWPRVAGLLAQNHNAERAAAGDVDFALEPTLIAALGPVYGAYRGDEEIRIGKREGTKALPAELRPPLFFLDNSWHAKHDPAGREIPHGMRWRCA